MAQVRLSVHELSQKRWAGSRAQAVSVLTLLANAIEDAAQGDEEVLKAVSEVRYQTERFKVSDALEHMKPLKVGLQAMARALGALQRELRIAGLDRWLASSRRAIGALTFASPFQLQRAAIQDAFRTLADTFVVAMQLAGKC